MKTIRMILAALVFAVFVPRPASATFHLMQIEQVIGGVNDLTSVQAIQLRMRSLGQNLVSAARLVVRDAAGANPVVLIDFTSNVANAASGARVLAATSAFSSATNPPLTPDFVLTNPIPASYIAAGSLTYEDDFGTVYWRLSWGGSSYTGPGTGAITNDADGNFDPPYAGPLPSTTAQALLFKFAATAPSTNNANDYALTAGVAAFTNNSGASGSINSLVGVDDGAAKGVVALEPPIPNPVSNSMAYTVVLPQETRVELRLVDIGGRVVRTLVDETMPAGQHHLTWDASSHDATTLSSGVYFLELNAGGARRTQRFVLIH
jgi:hypothetical protein